MRLTVHNECGSVFAEKLYFAVHECSRRVLSIVRINTGNETRLTYISRHNLLSFRFQPLGPNDIRPTFDIRKVRLFEFYRKQPKHRLAPFRPLCSCSPGAGGGQNLANTSLAGSSGYPFCCGGPRRWKSALNLFFAPNVIFTFCADDAS